MKPVGTLRDAAWRAARQHLGTRLVRSWVDPAVVVARHTPREVSLLLTLWRSPLKTATFETNRGTITAELYDKDAPKTVENFEKLANSGFYDGVKFHRVIPDFVVQGGDPLSRDLPEGDPRIGSGGPGWRIKCETAGNPRKHDVGALSMAHSGKDTGGSQFFMVLSEDNTRHLNGVHTVFGKITGGLDVMKQIKKNDVMTTVRVA
jgi:peptidyl-prolyl cis-trans isomerase B (cyclophilin B)